MRPADSFLIPGTFTIETARIARDSLRPVTIRYGIHNPSCSVSVRKGSIMAKKVTVTLIDDYDGKSKADETVQFSIDGVAYEIDLSTLNAGKLRGALEPWTEKSRKVGRLKSGGGTRTKSAADREQTVAIREWAKKHGYNVSARGRISSEVVAAYHKASK